MGFLNPLFLLAGGLILVPIFLHFFYRQESKTFHFPAIRYLLRTERDHARQIRTQQILLLLLRTAMVLLLVLLGARVHFPGPGGAHEPTALALVVDNSLSSTLIEDGERRLERLKEVARASAQAAGHDDVIWVLSAGTPWITATPGSAADALTRIDETEASHGAGDLGTTLERALALVAQSDLAAREVHVFTDLQASGFPQSPTGDVEIPIVVFGLEPPEDDNRSVRSVTVGGGLPPLANRRSEAVVETAGTGASDTIGVRLYIDGQVRAATQAHVGSTVRLPVGPLPPGPVEGFVEVDPDPLTADDRYYFAFGVREPTQVARTGQAPFFVNEALAVLEEDGRINLTGGIGSAATIVAAGGEALTGRDQTQTAVVFPLSDPARLPALNRQLAASGIPYRYEPGSRSGARVTQTELDLGLDQLEITTYFRMIPTEGEPTAQPVASLSNGDPWIVAGQGTVGSYVLFGSPFDAESTTLPVSAAMLPLLEWAIDRWSGGNQPGTQLVAGSPFTPPPTATAVRTPAGVVVAVDGDQPFQHTTGTGFYEALVGDSTLGAVAANAPASESDLAQINVAELRRVFPGLSALVTQPGDWNANVFKAGRGPEPWRPLLLLLLILLAVEGALAASGRIRAAKEAPLSPQASLG